MIDKNKKLVVRTRAVIVKDNKLLVVRHAHSKDVYVLPGGHLEWGEDIKESLKREIFEELGVLPQVGRLLYVNNYVEKETKQSIEFIFEITNVEDYLRVENLGGTHKYELAEIRWVSKDDDVKVLPKPVGDFLKSETLISNAVRFL